MSSGLLSPTWTHLRQVLHWYSSFCFFKKEECRLILNPNPQIQSKSQKFSNYTNAPIESKLATNKQLLIHWGKKSKNKLTLGFYQFNDWDSWKDRKQLEVEYKKESLCRLWIVWIEIEAYELWKAIWIWWVEFFFFLYLEIKKTCGRNVWTVGGGVN